jgi:cytochrome c
LWGVVGRPIGSHGGFAYSPAMKAQQGAWSYERLDQFLASPARDVPGTKMAFAGLRRAQDRAAVIKYLATLGGSAPAPRPMAAAGGQASGAR